MSSPMKNIDMESGSTTSDPPGLLSKYPHGIVKDDTTTTNKVVSDTSNGEDVEEVEDDPGVYHKHTEVDEDGFEWDVRDFSPVKRGITIFGLLLGFIIIFIEIGGNMMINQTLGVAIWMATLWLTEAIPHHITAFIPIIVFPLFGILKASVAAAQYFNNLNWLFISGFMVSLTLERWNLHKRFALKILTFCGNKPKLLLMGIMGATFFLSMFISNTATSLMMVTNGVSICQSLEDNSPPHFRHENKRFGIAIMLGIAYAANIGGMSSLIGTGPNLAFAQQLNIIFPDSPEFTFADWWFFGLPLGLITFFIIWAYLCLLYLRNFEGSDHIDPQMFVEQYKALGPWSREQVIVALLFILLAFFWVFRADLDFSTFVIHGWYNLFPNPKFITDTTIGMFIAFLMMICPARACMLPEESLARYKKKDDSLMAVPVTKMTTLLDWETANMMPYSILFLLGGGFCLAKAFQEGGLSAFLGDKLAELDISLGAIVFVMTFFIIWLTELTSNTSTSNIMIPIAGALAIGREVSPFTFMVPAAMACSCAFFLPIATPPNMVVFATGRLPLAEMNKAGVVLNIIMSVLILGATFTIVPAVLGVDPTEFPDWAMAAKDALAAKAEEAA